MPWDHTVLTAMQSATRDDIPAFTHSQIKLVLDLATPEGCKADLAPNLITAILFTTTSQITRLQQIPNYSLASVYSVRDGL